MNLLMNRYLPMFLIAAGLLLFVIGFIYDIVFAGIPYQDPTPEMSANYNRNSLIASGIRWSGVCAFLIGAISGIFRFLTRKQEQSAAS